MFFDPSDTWEKERQDSSMFIQPSTTQERGSEITSIPVTQTQISVHSVVPDVIDVTANNNKAAAERPLSPQENTRLQRSVRIKIKEVDRWVLMLAKSSGWINTTQM